MKKNLILSVLMLSVLIVSLSIVSAVENGEITFTIYMGGEIVLPEPGYISGDVLIEWDNVEDAFLKYQEGSCNGLVGGTDLIDGKIDSPDGSYEWDTTTVEDGPYCIKLTWGVVLYEISVTVDNTAPEIEFVEAPYFTQVDTEVIIEADIFDDSSGIEGWELDFGDGSPKVQGTTEDVMETHTYDEEDKYTVTLTATDNVGNEAVKTTIVVVNDEEPDWVIPLFTGINLFSIPLASESSDIEDVLPEDVSDNAEKIWAYQQGKWKYNIPDSSGWEYSTGTTTKVLDIVPGYGYMLFMNEDAVAYGDERELGAEQLPTEEIELTPGWNLIGHHGLISKFVGVALSSIDLGDNYRWDSVLTLNNKRDGYDEVTTEMFPTKGYWVSVITNDGPIYL